LIVIELLRTFNVFEKIHFMTLMIKFPHQFDGVSIACDMYSQKEYVRASFASCVRKTDASGIERSLASRLEPGQSLIYAVSTNTYSQCSRYITVCAFNACCIIKSSLIGTLNITNHEIHVHHPANDKHALYALLINYVMFWKFQKVN